MPIRSVRRFLLDRMVLRPTRHPIDHAPKRRVMLGTIECFVEQNYQGSAAPDLLILKFPGTEGRGERSTSFPMSSVDGPRVSTWTWNPPGYGRSSGRATLSRIADAALEFCQGVLSEHARAESSVWLCGNSLGCAAALHATSELDLDEARSGVILRNPPPLRLVVPRVAERYPLGHLTNPIVESLCDSMDVLHTAPRTTLPAVFLQSELDTLVPLDDQDQVVRAYAGPNHVVVMRGLGHADIPTEIHVPLINDALGWLRKRTRVPD